MKIDMKQVQTICGTWVRAFVAAVLASYMSGFTEPKYLVHAGLASVVPVVLRWVNPKDNFPVANPVTK